MLTWLRPYEQDLLWKLINDTNSTNKTLRVNGASFTAAWLRRNGSGENGSNAFSFDLGDVRAPVTASVTLPYSLLDALGVERAACVASAVSPEVAERTGPIKAALHVNLWKETGELLKVQSLQEEIRMELATRAIPEDVSCGFYNETLENWALHGVRDLPASSRQDALPCASNHLTLFAAILQGFIDAFLCAQLDIFSWQAFRQLFNGAWWAEPVAMLFWALLLLLASLMTAACVIDHRRARMHPGAWGPECFLVPTDTLQRPSIVSTGTQVESWCSQIVAFCEDTVGKDALDDICSRWFSYFGECRGFLEGLWAEVQAGTGRGRGLLRMLLSAIVTSSVRRQACASLRLGHDEVAFLTEDEHLGRLLLQAAKIDLKGPTSSWEEHLLAWRELHDKAINSFDQHWHNTSWRSLPGAFGRLLFVANPFTSVFLRGFFASCSIKVLLLSAELFGAVMVVTVFFQASNMSRGKEQSERCEAENLGFWEELGRILGIAVGSIIVASLPVTVLSSLRSRSFKKLPYVGSPEWVKQLKVWRKQDRMVWCMGGAYITFCVLFVSIFLANIAASEMPEWGGGSGLTLLEDMLLVPIGIALLVPLGSMVIVAMAECFVGNRKELLVQERDRLSDAEGNWRPYVMPI